MNGKIGFKQYQIECIIGDLPEEREAPQKIFVDLAVDVDLEGVVRSDDLTKGVDYMALAKSCETIAREGKFRLIETYAHHTLEYLLENFSILSAAICVKKPNCLPSAECTFVEMTRSKE